MSNSNKKRNGTLDDFALFLERIKTGNDQIHKILTKTNVEETEQTVSSVRKSKYVIIIRDEKHLVEPLLRREEKKKMLALR